MLDDLNLQEKSEMRHSMEEIHGASVSVPKGLIHEVEQERRMRVGR
jgi:hypothetical protein